MRKGIILAALLFLMAVSAGAACSHEFTGVYEAPTCSEPGFQGEQCIHCGQLRGMESVPELGHIHTEWVTTRSSTCDWPGEQERSCLRCGGVFTREIEKLPHSFVETVKKVTCRTDGYTAYTCSVCGYQTIANRVVATGHKYFSMVIEPTCTAEGYTRYKCSVCGDTVITNKTPAAGHQYDTGVLTKVPTPEKKGEVTYTCDRCGDYYTEPTIRWDGRFRDVGANDYYFPAVLWAVDNGITQGVAADRFGSSEVCTRAQVITFLWRRENCPRPKSSANPFRDVKKTDYYCEAVLWAVERGITQGTAKDLFSPNAPCTRCEAVTFLYRARGNSAKGTISYADVKTGDYFYDAVRWANWYAVTVGTSNNRFSPNDPCTRAQIITFIFRARDI